MDYDISFKKSTPAQISNSADGIFKIPFQPDPAALHLHLRIFVAFLLV